MAKPPHRHPDPRALPHAHIWFRFGCGMSDDPPVAHSAGAGTATGRTMPLSRLSRDPGEVSWNVMECHVLSCGPFPPGCGEGFGGGDRLRSFVPPCRQRAGRGVPVSRAIARAGGRGRGRAYRGGAVRARDCPRETCGRTSPARSRRGVFRGPSQSLSAEKPKGGPGSRLSLLSFYAILPNVKPIREQKMKLPEIFHEMPTAEAGGDRGDGWGLRCKATGDRCVVKPKYEEAFTTADMKLNGLPFLLR